jgi:hypothetical protein
MEILHYLTQFAKLVFNYKKSIYFNKSISFSMAFPIAMDKNASNFPGNLYSYIFHSL